MTLTRKKGLERKPFKRRASWIAPVSPKRRKANRERRAMLVSEEAENAPCEARLGGCDGRAVDPHEILTRGRLGSITERLNILLLCRACHSWITLHPDWSLFHGWEVNSWATAEDVQRAWVLRAICRCPKTCSVDHRLEAA